MKEKVFLNEYDVVILDELNNVLVIEKFFIDDVLLLYEVIDFI